MEEQVHHHHHHHHHHHSYEEHLRRKRRRQLLHRLFVSVGAVVSVLVIAFLLMAIAWPEKLMQWAGSWGLTDTGMVILGDPNPHLQKTYDGLDVSHHQGTIDWQKVGEDPAVQFVYVKATEGATFVDQSYAQNVKGAKSVGIAVGAYHYLSSGSSVHEQFRNFYRVVDRKAQDIVPMVDVEEDGVAGWSRRQLQDSLSAFLRLLESHYLCKPIIYSYAKFYNANLAPRFNAYRLFLSHYDVRQPVVAGNGRHDIWQHSDQGVIDGIDHPVDLDVFSEGTSLDDIKMPPYKPLPSR